MIELRNINKYYQSGTEKIHALKNINLVFPQKGLIFILGPSGCGKSTLLNLLGGLDKADEGEIFIENRAFSSFSKQDLNNYLNSYLGFVFQEYNILKDLNLYENISLPLEIQNVPKKVINEKVKKTIEDVDLKSLDKRRINELSGGQRQRIAIARALIKDPKLIIADEPTGNLDSVTGETIFNLFKKLSQDRLIVIVTHDEESAYKYGDRIVKIDDGAVVEDTLQTNEVQDYEPEQLKLKKAHVPLKISIKLALKNMWHKKFRFLAMALITTLSLVFLSFTIELNGDKIRENVYTSVEADYLYTDIMEKIQLPDNFIKTSVYDKYIGSPLSKNSYHTIKSKIKNLNLHQYSIVNIDVTGSRKYLGNHFFTGDINYIIKYDSSNTYELLAGRTPNSPSSEVDMVNDIKEVMITDYLVEMFNFYEIYPNASLPQDYLNKILNLRDYGNYNIVGIVKTNYEKWTNLSSSHKELDLTEKQNFAFSNDWKSMSAVYMPEEYFNKQRMLPNYTLNLGLYYMDANISQDVNSTNIKRMTLTSETQQIIEGSIGEGWRKVYYTMGAHPTSENQIALPINIARSLFPDISLEDTDLRTLEMNFNNSLNGKKVKIDFSSNGTITNTKEFTICGLLKDGENVELYKDTIEEYFSFLNDESEYVIAELPKSPESAYRLFKTAYKKGYILNVFAYRDDIDSYVVDPFISILSKVGLFVFAIFAIGILWTIISIEIVDSRKEIGIFRSIGLNGMKVSFVFIFQTLVVNIIAWGLSLIGSSFALKIFGQNITDDLGIIKLSMYMLTYRSPIFLIIFLIVITFVAIFIPLYKIMSQKIIDVISERDSL